MSVIQTTESITSPQAEMVYARKQTAQSLSTGDRVLVSLRQCVIFMPIIHVGLSVGIVALH